MVHVVKSAEELLKGRLSRRGFSSEDCQKILKSKGDVILLSKFSHRKNDLKDYVGVKLC